MSTDPLDRIAARAEAVTALAVSQTEVFIPTADVLALVEIARTARAQHAGHAIAKHPYCPVCVALARLAATEASQV